jgi:hypothetical protein
MAATLLANVSGSRKRIGQVSDRGAYIEILLPGILVPRATNTMAVTESLIPNVQPKCDATSPIIAVTTPIERIEITKHKYPPAMSAKRGM